MRSDLVDFEIQVLRACAGRSNTLTGWGAAVGEAASVLERRGLLEGNYRITAAGLSLLAELDEQESNSRPVQLEEAIEEEVVVSRT